MSTWEEDLNTIRSLILDAWERADGVDYKPGHSYSFTAYHLRLAMQHIDMAYHGEKGSMV